MHSPPHRSHAELAVAVTCGGAPAAGKTVTWTVEEGLGSVGESPSLPPATTFVDTTDANGVSIAVARHPSSLSQFLASNEPGSIVAEAVGMRSEFLVTAFNPGDSIPSVPHIRIVTPPSAGHGADVATGPSGAILDGAIRVQVINAHGIDAGRPVENIGIRLDDEDGEVRCDGAAGTALTDAEGIATCDVRLLGSPGTARFALVAGELIRWNGLRVEITP